MLKVDINDFPAVTALSTDEEVRRRENISDAGNLSGSLGGGAAGFSELLSINTASQSRLKEIVLPMLHALLSSKESESKAGGLNILGSFCGLSYDFTGVKITK